MDKDLSEKWGDGMKEFFENYPKSTEYKNTVAEMQFIQVLHDAYNVLYFNIDYFLDFMNNCSDKNHYNEVSELTKRIKSLLSLKLGELCLNHDLRTYKQVGITLKKSDYDASVSDLFEDLEQNWFVDKDNVGDE